MKPQTVRPLAAQFHNEGPSVYRIAYRWMYAILLCWTVLAARPGLSQVHSDSTPTPARSSEASAARQRVTVIDITNEVDLGMVSYVERATRKAEEDHSIILLHVNTFGGRVDAATKIRDIILKAQVPVSVAFIDKRAISAGALISLSARKIVMSPGSTMGAATPIYETGDKASEKVVSYMRAEMRSTAEQNHRDGKVAEAMVDESLGLDSSHGVTAAPGKLLTLTTEDALRVGYADTTAETIEGALAALGYPNATIDHAQEGLGDKAVRFLTLGIVSSILIMLGMGGIFYSIKTGHFGGITILAIVALLLFFGGQYITAVAPVLALILFLAGVTMLLIEIATPVPTFGLAGALGLGGILLGLFLALAGDLRTLTPDRMSQTVQTLAISLVGIIVIVALIIKYGPKATWLLKFRNEATTADTSFYDERINLVGQIGIAQTMLRPAGIVMIGERKIDAVTGGEFLDPGTPVIVARMTGNQIIVQAADDASILQDNSTAPDAGDTFGGRLPRS